MSLNTQGFLFKNPLQEIKTLSESQIHEKS